MVPAGLPAPQVDRGAWQDPPSWTRIFLAGSGGEARDGEACCAGASGELMCPSANCPNLTTFSSGLTRRRCARAPAATTPCAAALWRNWQCHIAMLTYGRAACRSCGPVDLVPLCCARRTRSELRSGSRRARSRLTSCISLGSGADRFLTEDLRGRPNIETTLPSRHSAGPRMLLWAVAGWLLL